MQPPTAAMSHDYEACKSSLSALLFEPVYGSLRREMKSQVHSPTLLGSCTSFWGGNWDKNDNLLKSAENSRSAENAISAKELFAFPAKILIIEPVLPSYLGRVNFKKNIPAKYCQNIRKIDYLYVILKVSGTYKYRR
ncbi:hypothetical protein TNCV_1981921 [Trichonephila clavipes]|nr:hypothetical protein TNCV_1981921 [Trichonephila clavipes]